MLKIKDNVDLKKLEKFGLQYQQVGMDYAYAKYMVKGQYIEHVIVWLDREIQVNAIKILDTLYDLIKADLVEKLD